MRRLLTLISCVCLTFALPAPAQPVRSRAEAQDAVSTIKTYAENLTFQEFVAISLLASGASALAFNAFTLGLDTKIGGLLIELVYGESAFPMALVVSMAAVAGMTFGALLLLIEPAKCATVTEYFMTEQGLPKFLKLSADEQLKYMSWDAHLNDFVVELAKRLPQIHVLGR